MAVAPFLQKWVVSAGVHVCSSAEMIEQIMDWARRGESRYVCYANAHMLVEAYGDEDFRRIVQSGDLVVSDGRPLAWLMRAAGAREQRQIRGPTAMVHLCGRAAAAGVPVGFYGSTESVLDAMVDRASREFPGIRVVYRYAPPFRPLTPEEDARVLADILASGCRMLFVGLGCPKQERWMAAHRGAVNAVMLGVGAAFDQYAGTIAACPAVLRRLGLEWAYRTLREPKRLLRRNARVLSKFAWLALRQLVAGAPDVDGGRPVR